MQEGGPEGFCGGHEIFKAYIDGSWKISWNVFQNFWSATKYFLMFYFRIFFKLRGLEHKISKLSNQKYVFLIAEDLQTRDP